MMKNLLKYFSKTYIQIILICVLTFLSFSNVFYNEFVGDDIDFLINWEDIRSFSNLDKILKGSTPIGHENVYRPLRGLIYLIEYQLVGVNEFFYHFQSILIHIIVSVLVYLIVRKIFKKGLLAFFSALIFGVHPIHTEMISFVAGSMDSFAFIFFFASFYFYLKKEESIKYYLLSLFLSVLAFTTYEVTLTLPILIVIYELTFEGINKKNYIKKIKEILPYFLTLGLFLFVRFIMLGIVERNIYQANSFAQTMLVNVKVLLKYLKLLFIPLNLSINHEISPGIFAHTFPKYNFEGISKVNLFNWDILFGIILFTFLVYISIKKIKQKKFRIISFVILWFFISFLPVINIVPHASLLAERYAYIASFSISLFLGYVIYFFIKNKNLRQKAVGIFLGCFITFWFLILTFQRNKDWRNEILLWENAVKLSPNNVMAIYKLGSAYRDKDNYEMAKKYYEKTIVMAPDFLYAYNNLGVILEEEGDFLKAEEYYLKALEFNPNLEETLNNLGVLYRNKEEFDKAILYYKKSLEVEPTNRSAKLNLLESYKTRALREANKGNLELALNNYLSAYEIDNKDSDILNNIGTIYAREKEFSKAIEWYEKALEINPEFEEAKNNLLKASELLSK